MTQNTELTIEILSSERDFDRAEADWNEVVNGASASSIFFMHDWFQAAWRWRRHDSELAIVLVKKGRAIVAVCPLVTTLKKIAGVQIRSLEFLSIPDTQECDFFCKPGFEKAVAVSITDWLARSPGWDVLELERLPPGAYVAQHLIPQLNAAPLPVLVGSYDSNLTLSLVGTWEEYYARRSRRLKKGLNLAANRIAKKSGEIDVIGTRLSEVSEPDRMAIKNDLYSTSANSWKRETTDTSFAATGPREFFEQLMRSEVMLEHIVVWRLMLDSVCVATELQLVKDGVVSALRADFDKDHDSLSPGSYLNKELLRQSFGSELVEYRMGPGTNAYKTRWSEGGIELQRASVYSKSMKGRFLNRYFLTLRPALLKFRSRMFGLRSRIIPESKTQS